jgi:hypothetical protein
VFVSEEVRMSGDDPVDTRESAIRRPGSSHDDDGDTSRQKAAEETTQQAVADGGTGEVTATREAAGMPMNPSQTATPPPNALPRMQTARGAGTVVRAPAAPAARSSADMRRPSEIATPPRGTTRPGASSAPARASSDASWLPPRRAEAPPASKPEPPPEEIEEEDARSRPTFERAKLSPVVAESLRERPRDPLPVRIVTVGILVLILGLTGYTFLEPMLRGRKEAVVESRDGSLSVIGRTGDHVKIQDSRGATVYGASLPFSKLVLPSGDYTVTVTGPFDDRLVSGTVSIGPGKSGIFDAHLAVATPIP